MSVLFQLKCIQQKVFLFKERLEFPMLSSLSFNKNNVDLQSPFE